MDWGHSASQAGGHIPEGCGARASFTELEEATSLKRAGLARRSGISLSGEQVLFRVR